MGASGQTQSALPCRPGNSLVAQGEVPSIGNGTMRQVFFTAGRIFFRAIADFPALGGKRSCPPEPGSLGVIKYVFTSTRLGFFSHAVRKKLAEHRSRADIPLWLSACPSAQKNFQTAHPGLPDRPDLQPLLQGLTRALPCPTPSVRTEKFPQAKTVCVGAISMGMFCPCHGQSLRTSDVVAAIRRSTTARDAPSCLATRMREGDFPHGKPPLICPMMT